MFSDRIALQIADAAKAAGISETGMLAIVEVETAGNPFEADGHTPQFLFERHIFHRELKARAPEKLDAAVKAGLAIPTWSPSTQYKDEGHSQQKMELLSRARTIDEECALRSCSWGLPQIMGNECMEVGFATAKAMVAFLTSNGIGGHLALMVKFLKARKLVGSIQDGDWAHVALRYNGKGYARNHYDTRLAGASKKWERKLPALRATGAEDFPELHLNRDQVKSIQMELRHLNYPQVGNPDGRWGDNTAAAIFAFQKHEGLSPTGHFDDATRDALTDANARLPPEERANATVDDLREQGSSTIKKADTTENIGLGKVITGGTIAGGTILKSAITPNEAIDKANDAVDKVHQVKGLWGSVQDLLPSANTTLLILAAVVLVGGGVWVILRARGIKASRLLDYQLGIHAGTVRE